MEERNISWMCARRDTYRMVSLYLLPSVRHLFPSVIHPNLTHAQINKRYSRSIGRRLATVVQRPIKMQLDNVENKYRIETMKKTVSWLNGKWKMRQTCPIIRNGIWCVDFDFDGVQILHLIQQQCTLATVVISHMQRHSHSLRAQPALSPPIQFFFHVLIAHPNDRFFITNITSMVRHDDFDGNSFTTQITNSQPIFRSIPSQSNYNHMEFQFQTCTKCLLGDIEVTMHLQASEDLSNNKKTHSQHFMQTMWSVPSPTLPLNLSSHFRCITFFLDRQYYAWFANSDGTRASGGNRNEYLKFLALLTKSASIGMFENGASIALANRLPTKAYFVSVVYPLLHQRTQPCSCRGSKAIQRI